MTFTMTASHGRVQTLGNRAAALRWISTNMQFGGWHRPVEALYMSTDKQFPTDEGGWHCWYYHFKWQMTFEEYRALAKVQQRYKELCHFTREVDAQWRNDGPPQHWADNSVEQDQVNRHGVRRTVMVKAPGGDACF